ncbi:unnamed protein product [Prunus brigantina]
MLDTITTKHRAYLLIDEWGAIIGDNLIRDSKSTYDIFTDEICDGSPYGLPKRNCLNPLCEIFGGCEDPYVAVGWWMDSPNQVKPPSMKGPRSAHVLQQRGRLVT